MQDFWRNYFYRVSLVKQSSQLNSLAKSGGGDGEGSTDTSTAEGPQTPSDDGKGKERERGILNETTQND